MNGLFNKILYNKENFKKYFNYLDSRHNGRLSRKLEKEANHVNTLSVFPEIEFGYIINKLFPIVEYEPTIKSHSSKAHGKTPDWIVRNKEETIIFEVKKINPPNEQLVERTKSFMRDQYTGLNFVDSNNTNYLNRHLSKIIEKEKVYRDLITKSNYRLVVCSDFSSLNEFSDKQDLIDHLSFECKFSVFNKYPEFVANVAGLMLKPTFGNIFFLKNTRASFKLSEATIELFSKLDTVLYPT